MHGTLDCNSVIVLLVLALWLCQRAFLIVVNGGKLRGKATRLSVAMVTNLWFWWFPGSSDSSGPWPEPPPF